MKFVVKLNVTCHNKMFDLYKSLVACTNIC